MDHNKKGDTDLSGYESHSDTEYSEATVPSQPPAPGKDLHTFTLPTRERALPNVPPPRAYILKHDELFDIVTNLPNLDLLKQHLFEEGKILKEDVLEIVNRATQFFLEEPNILIVKEPVTIVGDVHGQFYDLMKLFEIGGDPKTTQYLFLGDYVDRGYFSIEIVLLLYSYKLHRPDAIHLIRGNHECRHLTDYFTFKEECEKKYDLDVYNAIMESFDALPLAAVVLNSFGKPQFLCVHGGLGPDIRSLEDIENIDRFREPPSMGPMCDLLWADPLDESLYDETIDFRFNTVRGCSYNFGFKAACDFLEKTGLLSIVRAHEAQDEGFKMYRKSPKTQFPTVITIFSAPNYLEAYNNKAAIMKYENNVINIKQFNNVPHPYWLPGFMNVFTWSLPFVAEKVSEILLCFLNLVNDEQEDTAVRQEIAKRREIIRAKIAAVSRMLRVFAVLRKERETIMSIKGLSPSAKLPPGLLMEGPDAIIKALGDFQKAKMMDLPNEKRPPGVEVFVSRSASSPRLSRSGSNLRNSGKFLRSSSENLLVSQGPSLPDPIITMTPPDSPVSERNSTVTNNNNNNNNNNNSSNNDNNDTTTTTTTTTTSTSAKSASFPTPASVPTSANFVSLSQVETK